MTRAPRPDFLVIGAPKAGTTALHAALAQHPDVFVSDPKEPKYWLCDGAPPPAWCGPGDKHSQQEWIWRADRYFPLFEPAAEHQVRGESTPFYLWSRGAHRRIAEAPARGAGSSPSSATRSTGPTATGCTCGPTASSPSRTSSPRSAARPSGSAPGGRRSGATASSAATASSSSTSTATSTRRGSSSSATATSSTSPAPPSTGSSRFLGIREGLVDSIPRDNSRGFVPPGLAPRASSGPSSASVRGSASSRRPRSGGSIHPLSISLLGDSRAAAPPSAGHHCAGSGSWTRTPTTSRCSSELTGQDFERLALAGEPRLVRQRSATVTPITASQRTQVTRSCAPSSRAAST